MNLNELRDEAERIGREHGFTDATIGDDIALMHSELSEALEDHRNSHKPAEVWYEEKVPVFDKDGKPIMAGDKQVTIGVRHEEMYFSTDEECPFCQGTKVSLGSAGDRSNPPCSSCRGTGKKQGLYKPCGIPSELADVIIRALHFSGRHGVDIMKAVEEKMAYNETRPFKHGGRTI